MMKFVQSPVLNGNFQPGMILAVVKLRSDRKGVVKNSYMAPIDRADNVIWYLNSNFDPCVWLHSILADVTLAASRSHETL